MTQKGKCKYTQLGYSHNWVRESNVSTHCCTYSGPSSVVCFLATKPLSENPEPTKARTVLNARTNDPTRTQPGNARKEPTKQDKSRQVNMKRANEARQEPTRTKKPQRKSGRNEAVPAHRTRSKDCALANTVYSRGPNGPGTSLALLSCRWMNPKRAIQQSTERPPP